MNTTVSALCFTGTLFLSGCATANTPRGTAHDNAALFKNFAFAQCVSRGYQAPEVKEDAAAVAEGYLQRGEVSDVQAYGEAVKLAEQWLQKRYDSKSNQPLQLMKCLDFLNSRELQGLADKYAVPAKKPK